MLEEKEFERNQSSQYGLEKGSSLKIAEVKINALEEELSILESITIEIEHKSVEINGELKQELNNLGNEMKNYMVPTRFYLRVSIIL